MTLTLSVPDNYAYVLLAGVGTGWLTLWQAFSVGASRKRANIPYPQAYAEQAEVEKSLDAKKFNCAQRAHQNTLESVPHILFFMTVAGLEYPLLTAGLGATWLLGRVMYTIGYKTGDPSKRQRGGFHNISYIGLMLTATWTTAQLAYNLL